MPKHDTITAVRSDTTTTWICVIDGWRELDDDREHGCLPCERRMRAQLDYLDAVLPMLRAVYLTEPTRTGELDLGALDLTLDAHPHYAGDRGDLTGATPIATVLGRHLEAWGLATADSIRPGEAINLMRRQLGSAFRYGAGLAQLAADLRQLHGQTRHALDRNLTETRYTAPCPYDGGQLAALPGDWIRCDRCIRLWDEGEYATIALGVAPSASLLYAHELALAVGAEPARIRKLIERGRLVPVGQRPAGHDLYELGATRRVLDEVRLWNGNVGRLILWCGPSSEAATWTEVAEHRAGTEIEVAGCRIRIQRGKTITIGPIPEPAAPVDQELVTA